MKQVEKIWAELSAKAQEIETPQEVELSEEQVELGISEELDAIKQLMDGIDLDIGDSEAQGLVKRAYDAIKLPSKARMSAMKLEKALKDLQSAGMGSSRIANAIQQKLDTIELMSNQAKRLRKLLGDMVGEFSKR